MTEKDSIVPSEPESWPIGNVTVGDWNKAMSKSRIYIAGPMTNLPGMNYAAFDAAEKILVRLGFDVENPTANDQVAKDLGIEPDWRWFMRQSIAQVIKCDSFALLPGWATSKGARLETTIALALDLQFWLIEDYGLTVERACRNEIERTLAPWGVTPPSAPVGAPALSPKVCTDPDCTIPRKPGFPMHGPHDFKAAK